MLGFAVAAAALGLTWSLRTEGDVSAEVVPAVAALRESVAAPATPSFDVIRIGEKGDMVVAGRAQPQAEVTLRDGERELGRGQADERGEWVLVPTLALSAGAHALSLEARGAEGAPTRSPAPVIVVVPENGLQPALAVAPQVDGGARLVLGPGGEAGPVSVDLIDRDASGALFIGGRAPAGNAVQLYLENVFLGRAVADGDGGWRLAVRQAAAAGTVRADLVDERAKVRARVEVPLAPPAQMAAGGGEAVNVEPGAGQWTIIRPGNGGPAGYTVIYGAGKERVRDAGRVYPGQVVQVPKN